MSAALLLESWRDLDGPQLLVLAAVLPGLALAWWLMRRGPRPGDVVARADLAMPMIVTAAAAFLLAQPWPYRELEQQNLTLFYGVLGLQRLGFALLAVFVCKKLFPEDGLLPLRVPRSLRKIFWALALYACLLPFVLLIGHFREDEVVQESARDLQDAGAFALRASLFLALVVAAPFFEEVVFRGLVQGGLRRTMAAEPAVIVSSLLFMSVHDRALWPQVLCLGALLGIVQERTRSLWAPIVVHVVHNAWTFAWFLQSQPGEP